MKGKLGIQRTSNLNRALPLKMQKEKLKENLSGNISVKVYGDILTV